MEDGHIKTWDLCQIGADLARPLVHCDMQDKRLHTSPRICIKKTTAAANSARDHSRASTHVPWKRYAQGCTGCTHLIILMYLLIRCFCSIWCIPIIWNIIFYLKAGWTRSDLSPAWSAMNWNQKGLGSTWFDGKIPFEFVKWSLWKTLGT